MMIKLVESVVKLKAIPQIHLLLLRNSSSVKCRRKELSLMKYRSYCHFSTSPVVEIVDKDKLIRSLEEGLAKVSDPKTGLDNVELLIKLK